MNKNMQDENKSRLPITALLLNIIPFVIFIGNPDVIVLAVLSIFPFAGFIVGVTALCFGKKRIGKTGMVISIIAVAWPVVFVAAVILIGAMGALTFNM